MNKKDHLIEIYEILNDLEKEISKKKDIWKQIKIDNPSFDQSGFPGLKGFSRSNVFYMRMFSTSYARIQQAAGLLEVPPDFCLNIPWWHNVILIEKVKDLNEREWYARKAVENGCSRSVLEMWIETDLYHRQGKAPNNFQTSLPAPYSDLAEQVIKDPYCFDFLTIIDQAREKRLNEILGQEPILWAQIESLASEKKAKSYDKAVELLTDLRDLAARTGFSDFQFKLKNLRERHSPKSSFIERLRIFL